MAPVMVRISFGLTGDDSHYFLCRLVVLVMSSSAACSRHGHVARVGTRHARSAVRKPVRVEEILLGKVIPYFALGMIGLVLCMLSARFSSMCRSGGR